MIAVSPVETTLCVALTVFNLVLLARVIAITSASGVPRAISYTPGHRTAPLGL